MRRFLFATPLALLALLGCAQTTGWQSACPELSKNAEEIRNLEDRITRLQADGPSADPELQATVVRLEERRRDLQLDNIQLADHCGPPGPNPDELKRTRERLPEPR